MNETILLAHGSGGRLSHELTTTLFARYFANPALCELGDSAQVDLPGWEPGCRLALTTDSFVVKPLVFPGGDIGKLAVCGTVNDLAVAGARPLYLSAGFILEEGLGWGLLERIVASMAETARLAGVPIVAGDTKVVERGAADGVYITTSGVGVVPAGLHLSPANLRPGDLLLVNGTLGDHGIAVMLQREGLAFQSDLRSDCAPLHDLVQTLLAHAPGAARCLRDATRGGLATVLNEWAEDGSGIELDEPAIPIREDVRAACEVLGLDPLYAANEGKVVAAVAPAVAPAVLAAWRAHPLGREAAIIGRVVEAHPGRVVLRTSLGVGRMLEMLQGAPLPRIC